MLNHLIRFLIVSLSGLVVAQTESADPKGGEPGWQAPRHVTYPEKEVLAECRKYNNQYIGYYSKVYFIESCQRREIDANGIERLMKAKVSIQEVEVETIAKIPPGPSVAETKSPTPCGQLNGRYVLSTGGDMYVINNCQKHLLPDWETYVDHAKRHRQKKVYELSEEEFARLKTGPTLPSVLDEEYSKNGLAANLGVDMIPIEEACSGVNGRYVSYYSKVYKIENCRKREVEDPAHFTKTKRSVKVLELTTEQWMSLPDAKNL